VNVPVPVHDYVDVDVLAHALVHDEA